MMKVWKRNAVAATVLLFVCTAVYLNFQYAGNVVESSKEDTEQKILGQSTLVSNQETVEETGSDAVASETSSDYFASARLSRQQARDSAIAMLTETAESETANTEAVNAAAETIEVLASYAIEEAMVENLITAKGYADCVAFMGEDSISVVVSVEDGLEATDVAKITDIVLSETNYTADQIKILETN